MSDQTNPITSDPDPEMLRNLLQRVPLGATQTIIITRGPQLLAHRGTLKQMEALDVTVQVANEWRDSGQSLRVQFIRLPLSPYPRLVLVHPLRDPFRLIIVDGETAAIEPLRKLSNQLLGILEVAGIGRKS